MLDEPMAGMNVRKEDIEPLKSSTSRRNLAPPSLLIEHDMG